METNFSKYDFYIQTVQSGAIRTLFEALKEVLIDVNLTFDEHGIKIMTLDGTRIALVHLFLDSSKFVVYECNKPSKIGVNMYSLFKLLKLAGNEDVITMYVSKNESSRLNIIIHNKIKNTRTHSKLKLLDINEDILDIPDVEFDSVITIPSSDFQKICRDLSIVADTLVIESDDTNFVMSAEGDIGDIKIELGESPEQNGLVYRKRIDTGKVKGKFDLKYLNLFTKSTSLCSQLEIFLKQDYPLIMLYSVANLGSLKYILGPKNDEAY